MRDTHAGPGPWRALVLTPLLLATLGLFSADAGAQRKERLGKEVVDAVCAGCHLDGKDKAPRIGDAEAWKPRAAQGLTALTEHALTGLRKMPAHGGSPGVSDIEIERAITYMVNQSGGNWVEPVGGATPAVLRSSETIVRNQCAGCHQDGKDGAPKIGDRVAWVPHLKKGLDALVLSAVRGHGPMPARGGMPDLSDQEIRGAIVHMFNHGLPDLPPPAAAAPLDPRHKIVSGTDVYLGLLPAEKVRAARGAAAAAPSGKGYYHLNISLADNKSQVSLTDAEVKVRVSDGMTTETRALELLAANQSVSYGNYFRLASGNAYNITAEIRRPGMPTPIVARFDYKAP